MIVLRILGWEPDRGWVDWSDYQRRHLEGRLRRLTDLDRVAVKRLARQIRDRECREVPLGKAADRLAAEPLRGLLESLGAAVTVAGTILLNSRG